MNQFANHPAVTVLESFFNAMNAWGLEMIEHYQTFRQGKIDPKQLECDRKTQRDKLNFIFAEYCEVGLSAKRLQDQGMSFGAESPDYDLSNELIEAFSEKGIRALIETKQIAGYQLYHKYEIIKTERGWKIRDNKKRRSGKNPTWRNDLL